MSKVNEKRKLREIKDDPDYSETENLPKARNADRSCANEGVCIIHFDDSSIQSFVPLENDSLQTLLQIKDLRSKEHDSSKRMDSQCRLLNDYVNNQENSNIGYHRDCYRKFTRHWDRLCPEDETAATSSMVRRSSSSSSGELCRFVYVHVYVCISRSSWALRPDHSHSVMM